MADTNKTISTITIPSGTTVSLKDTEARSDIASIKENYATKSELNNGKLTIQTEGTDKGSFTANQSTDTVINITAKDLGLSGAMNFLGTSTTKITDGATTNPITIDGKSVTATSGNVVLYGSKEFVWANSAWEELGDESSHALKSVTITGTGLLEGGGSLEANRTISHKTVSRTNTTSTVSPTSGGTFTAIDSITSDNYGHISKVNTKTITLPSGSTYTLPPATSTALGGVKVGSGLSVTSDGTLSASSSGFDLPNLGTLELVFTHDEPTWDTLCHSAVYMSEELTLSADQIALLETYFSPTTGMPLTSTSSFIAAMNDDSADPLVFSFKTATTDDSGSVVGSTFACNMGSTTLVVQISIKNSHFSTIYACMFDNVEGTGYYVSKLGQEKLVSGTNIKTINGNSLLGSGDLKISGGVTSVQTKAGTGLSVTTSTAQTGDVTNTISVASNYKLPTTTEWSNKADTSTVTSVSSRVTTLESKSHYKISVSGTTLTITAE